MAVKSIEEMTGSQKKIKSALQEIEVVSDIEDWPGSETETQIECKDKYIPSAIFNIIREHNYEVIDIHPANDKVERHAIHIKEE